MENYILNSVTGNFHIYTKSKDGNNVLRCTNTQIHLDNTKGPFKCNGPEEAEKKFKKEMGEEVEIKFCAKCKNWFYSKD